MSFGQQDPIGAQADYRDFAERYRQGAPSEGYTDQEALDYYGRVAPQLPPRDYQDVARQAFERMSPQERMQFGQYLQQQARQQGVAQQFPDLDRDGIDDRLQDSDFLAQQTSRMEQRQPGMLGQLLGGGGAQGGMGGVLGHPLAKVALGGMAAYGLARAVGDTGLLGGGERGGLGGMFGGRDREGGDYEERRHREYRGDRDEDEDDDRYRRPRGDDDDRRRRDRGDDDDDD